MRDMLRLANADLTIASDLCKNYGNDEVFINYAAYHCSQAAEKMLKAFILSKGEIPPKVHRLVELRGFIENRNLAESFLNTIFAQVRIWDDWISTPRYVVSYIASITEVREAIVILTETLHLLDEKNVDSTGKLSEELSQCQAFGKDRR